MVGGGYVVAALVCTAEVVVAIVAVIVVGENFHLTGFSVWFFVYPGLEGGSYQALNLVGEAIVRTGGPPPPHMFGDTSHSVRQNWFFV